MITENLDIFFDTAGFGSTHTIAGVAGVVCIVGDKLQGMSGTGGSDLDGAQVSLFDVMVKKTAISAPTLGKKITFDGTSYTVEQIKDDGSVLTITLSTARLGEMVRPI